MKLSETTIDKLALGDEVDSRTRTRDVPSAGLQASIKAHGLLQPLVVRALERAGICQVVAGNRRLNALRALVASNEWAHDRPIPIIVIEADDDATAIEASLAENVLRHDLHAVEEYEAFTRLKALGRTEAEIAAGYGVSELGVKQRLALGALSPVIRDAWFAGKIDEKCAMTFTLEPDTARQEEIYEAHSTYGCREWDVRRALNLDADQGQMLKFVGRDVFTAAGGEYVDDLFGNSPRVISGDLLRELVAAKLKAECERLVGEGWKWALPSSDVAEAWKYPHIEAEPNPTAEQQAEHDKITDRIQDLEENSGDEMTEAESEEYDRLVERAEELDEQIAATGVFSPEQKAKGGCLLSISREGELVVSHRTAPGEKAPEPRAATISDGGKPAGPKKVDPFHVSAALVQALTEQRTVAISRTIAGQPHIALAAACASLRVWGCEQGPVRLRADGHHVVSDMSRKANAPRWNKLFTEYLGCPDDHLLKVLAEGIAQSINAVSHNPDVPSNVDTDALVSALPVDVYVEKAIEAFDYERYFNGITVAGRMAAIESMEGADMGPGLKKAEQVAHCVSEAKRTGWLPRELAVPGAFVKGKAKKAAPKAKDKPAPKASAKKKAA